METLRPLGVPSAYTLISGLEDILLTLALDGGKMEDGCRCLVFAEIGVDSDQIGEPLSFLYGV